MPNDFNLTNPRLGRRDLLRYAGLGAGAAALAACGVGGKAAPQATGTALSDQIDAFWADKKKTGSVNWAHWPYYIDKDGKGGHPTIDQFTAATGIKVHFTEPIQDTGSFFAKVQPSLSAGQYSGYDVATITNGTDFDKFKQLGLLVPLDHARLPNFNKYAAPAYKRSAYDPGNVYSIPWQSGITGIGYNKTKVPKPLTSFFDLFDPALKGKVGMFADNQDLPNAALVAMFGDPSKTGEAQWRQAATKLTQQRKSGVVRKYYEQEYINALSDGDIWASQAWSGDIFQAVAGGAKDLVFAIPSEGGVLWTDNFVLFKQIKHPVDAMMLMDWYYRPQIAAEAAESINYITPVPAAKDVILQDAANATGADKTALEQLAKSPLVFPSPEDYSKLYRYRDLTNAEAETWNGIFEPIYQS
jgi:spermidine/putrescine transport system substrate-binding protein